MKTALRGLQGVVQQIGSGVVRCGGLRLHEVVGEEVGGGGAEGFEEEEGGLVGGEGGGGQGW